MTTTTVTSRVYGSGDVIFVAEIECPYCGNKQRHTIPSTERPFVVLCDTDDSPGCDRYFVARVALFATVTAMPIDDGAAQ